MWIEVTCALIAGVSGGLATVSCYGAYRHRIAAEAAASSPARTAQSAASQIASLNEQLSDLQTAVEGLLNREKMRRVRQGAKVTGEPDPVTEPAAWKTYMRRNAALGGRP